jgi:glutaredoxin 3
MPTIEIFSSPHCGYCDRAKQLLTEKGAPSIDRDTSPAEHRDEFVRRLPRARSTPQIFIDGSHIGGFEDLEILRDDGRLDDLLSG